MTYRGIVRNGVVILDDETLLPDGTTVEVRPAMANDNSPILADADFNLDDLAKHAVDTGIPDLATNHDHYLYGHPKVADER